MFRRFRNSGPRGGPLGGGPLAKLQQANRLMMEGRFVEAGDLLAQLAKGAQTNNHPRRAAELHARAAHSYADGSQQEPALAEARSALSLFLQFQMAHRAPVFLANITRKLSEREMATAAEELKREFGSRVGPMPAVQAGADPQRGHLPTSCPQCGAPMNPKEVDWVDAATAECRYCGSMVRTEKA
jgi:hypothetical protein